MVGTRNRRVSTDARGQIPELPGGAQAQIFVGNFRRGAPRARPQGRQARTSPDKAGLTRTEIQRPHVSATRQLADALHDIVAVEKKLVPDDRVRGEHREPTALDHRRM